MKRPRIKCARCGKRRVPSRYIKSVRWLHGENIDLKVEWSTVHDICSQCSEVIGKLMFAGLYEKI